MCLSYGALHNVSPCRWEKSQLIIINFNGMVHSLYLSLSHPSPGLAVRWRKGGGGGGTVRSGWGTSKQGNISKSTTRAHSLDQQQKVWVKKEPVLAHWAKQMYEINYWHQYTIDAVQSFSFLRRPIENWKKYFMYFMYVSGLRGFPEKSFYH